MCGRDEADMMIKGREEGWEEAAAAAMVVGSGQRYRVSCLVSQHLCGLELVMQARAHNHTAHCAKGGEGGKLRPRTRGTTAGQAVEDLAEER